MSTKGFRVLFFPLKMIFEPCLMMRSTPNKYHFFMSILPLYVLNRQRFVHLRHAFFVFCSCQKLTGCVNGKRGEQVGLTDKIYGGGEENKRNLFIQSTSVHHSFDFNAKPIEEKIFFSLFRHMFEMNKYGFVYLSYRLICVLLETCRFVFLLKSIVESFLRSLLFVNNGKIAKLNKVISNSIN